MRTNWLIVGVLLIATAPPSCEQPKPVEPPQLLVGQKVPLTITSRDQRFTGSSTLSRVFQVTADKGGVLRATLTWAKGVNGLRLELWNGNDGDGTCCHSGESVSVPVTKGDRVEIHVLLAEPQARNARQAFELKTSIRQAQD